MKAKKKKMKRMDGAAGMLDPLLSILRIFAIHIAAVFLFRIITGKKKESDTSENPGADEESD